MNIEQIIIDFYHQSNDVTDILSSNEMYSCIDVIAERISQNKAIYTVLITLAVYKYLHPEQDIRQHKKVLPNGFSARSFDTKFVTPTLQKLGLPAMMESGWLTRSLEQVAPFDFHFPGRITPDRLKVAFLSLVDEIEKGNATIVLRLLLNKGIQFSNSNNVTINKINNPDIQIDKVINLLKQHFENKYSVHGGAKLPILAFYAIYKMLTIQMDRFKNCKLLPLGSLTASDRSSKSAGDIQVAYDNYVFEAVEIKLDRLITPTVVRNAYAKIVKFGVRRYYILSSVEIQSQDKKEIDSITQEIRNNHGCELIINGLYTTLKYYLRLIINIQEFVNDYIELVEQDKELELLHKQKLVELLERLIV